MIYVYDPGQWPALKCNLCGKKCHTDNVIHRVIFSELPMTIYQLLLKNHWEPPNNHLAILLLFADDGSENRITENSHERIMACNDCFVAHISHLGYKKVEKISFI